MKLSHVLLGAATLIATASGAYTLGLRRGAPPLSTGASLERLSISRCRGAEWAGGESRRDADEAAREKEEADDEDDADEAQRGVAVRLDRRGDVARP